MKYLILFIQVFISYLIGAVPVGFIIFKVVKGGDIRHYGSGNVGATNVLRNTGKVWGILTFILDFLKGVVPVLGIPIVFYRLFEFEPLFQEEFYLRFLLGTTAVIGHIYPIYIGFKGGKGVAVFTGVFAVLFPLPLAISMGVFVLAMLVFRIVSLSVLISSLFLGIFSLIYLKFSAQSYFAVLPFLIFIFSHRSNIKRLIKGKEKKAF